MKTLQKKFAPRARYLLTGVLCLVQMPVALAQNDDFGFEMMEGEVKDDASGRYDAAGQLLRQERYNEALAAYSEILSDAGLKKYHEDAEYDSAKALFRLGLHHAALDRYSAIIQNEKHRYLEKSREWVFFLARRMTDSYAAVTQIAQHTKMSDLPPESRDEFNYQLARYYLENSIQKSGEAEILTNKEEDKEDGEFDFSEGDGKEDDPLKFKDEDISDGEPEEGFDFSGGDIGPATKRRANVRDRRLSKKKPADDDALEFDMSEGEKAEVVEESVEEKGLSATQNLAKALTHVEQVSTEYTFHAKALYLKGLILYAQEKFEPSVDAFQEVVRMTHPQTGSVAAPKLREMSFFSLARIHYQFEQFRYAIFYYERIDRNSERWLDALFEAGWAYFRLGEYEKSLGNLVTIQSPFFVDEYYPESHILKAITFYENCRYPEAQVFLGEFTQRYSGVMTELDRLVGQDRSPEDLYTELLKLQEMVEAGGDDDVKSFAATARLLRLALSDHRLELFSQSIAEVDVEVGLLSQLTEPFAGTEEHGRLIEVVQRRRSELVQAGGGLLKNKLTAERGFLQDLKAKLLRIQFEIGKGVKEGLEAQLVGESQEIELDPLRFTAATDDERVYWPFVGEYWRDELGTYRYTLTKSCRPADNKRIE